MMPSAFNCSWTILLSILAIVSCEQTKSSHTDTQKASIETVQSVDTSLIAIIPFEKSSGWLFDKTYSPSTLTQSDIEKIERLITDCIKQHNSKLTSVTKQYFTLNLTKGKYKRQYVAVTNKNGDKEVWINCLCQTHGGNWKTTIIMVDDGGNCYFNLKINLTKEKCYNFQVNGYA